MPLLSRDVPRWVIVTVLVAGVFYGVARYKRDFWDFEVYRVAAERALAAEPLYQPGDGHYQFKYWPTFALVCAPFALIPEELGKPLWFGLTLLCIIGLIRRSVAELPARRLSSTRLTWLVSLVLAKCAVIELVNGQTNALLAVLMVGAVSAARTQRWRTAGVLVAAATFVKPYALILLPWLAVAGGGLALTGFSLTLLGGLLLPALRYGWTGNLTLLSEWYRTVTETTEPNLLVRENISVASAWAKWLGISDTAALAAAATALLLLLVPLVLLLLRRRVSAPDHLDVAGAMLVVPLVSPQGWDYVLLLGAPAFAALVDRWPSLGRAWQGLLALSLFLIGFGVYDVLGRTLYFFVAERGVLTLAAIVATGALVHLRLRRLA